VTVQGLAAKGPVQAGVWGEVRVKVEAGWADRLLQGQVEVVSVRNVEQQSLMLPDSLVMR